MGNFVLRRTTQLKLLEAAIQHHFSQLAEKYGVELVIEIWYEIRKSERDVAFFEVCGWKPEMTVTEALRCLQDYVDFVESVLLKFLAEHKKGNHYRPAFFN